MKIVFSTVILGLFLSFTGAAQAQVYDVYYYWDGAQYQQYWPQSYDLYSYGDTNQYPEQLYDPYYQLHVMHYQLYLPQYQPYFYQSCCFAGGVVVPRRPIRVWPGTVNSWRPSPISSLPGPFSRGTRHR